MTKKIFLLLALLVAPLQETAVAKKSSGIPKGVKIAGSVAGFVVGGALLIRHLLKKPTDYVPEDSDIYSPEELEAMREAQGRSYGNLIGAGVAGAIGAGFGASLAFGGDSNDDDDDDGKGGMNGKPRRDLVKEVFGKTEQEIAAMRDTERGSFFRSIEGIDFGFYDNGLLGPKALLEMVHGHGYRDVKWSIETERKKRDKSDVAFQHYGPPPRNEKGGGSIHFHVGKVDVKEFMADPENSGAVFLVPVSAGEKLDNPDLSIARMAMSNSYADNALAAALPAAIARKHYFHGSDYDLLGSLVGNEAFELNGDGQICRTNSRLLWGGVGLFDSCRVFRHCGVPVYYGKDFSLVGNPKSQKVTFVYAPIFDPRCEVPIQYFNGERGGDDVYYSPGDSNEKYNYNDLSRRVTKFFAQSAYLLASMTTLALVKQGSSSVKVINKIFVPMLDCDKFGNSLEVTLDALALAARHAKEHGLELHVLWPVDPSVVRRYGSWEDYLFSADGGICGDVQLVFDFYKVITACPQLPYNVFVGDLEEQDRSVIINVVKGAVTDSEFIKVIWHDS